MWAFECCKYRSGHVFSCHIDQGVREEEQTSAMTSTEEVLTEQRDALKVEIEHEQRVTMEVESWLKDRNVHLNKLHEGEINFNRKFCFDSICLGFWFRVEWKQRLATEIIVKEDELQSLIDSR